MFCTIEVCDGYGKADCRTYYFIAKNVVSLIKIGQVIIAGQLVVLFVHLLSGPRAFFFLGTFPISA